MFVIRVMSNHAALQAFFSPTQNEQNILGISGACGQNKLGFPRTIKLKNDVMLGLLWLGIRGICDSRDH